MTRSFLRAWLCKSFNWALTRIGSDVTECDLKRDALVFSPHFDDETLGCGGTIIKKKKAGADVKIVFMTDGSKSHKDLIPQDKLMEIRKSEAFAASQSLGLKACDVFPLEFEEEKLSEHTKSATKKVTDILMYQHPDEIFVPFHKEPPLWSNDHLATNRIVGAALQTYQENVTIYEYPIWFWYNWPWSSPTIHSFEEILGFLKNGLVSSYSLLKEFRCFVYIGDVLEQKRFALDQYKSQMTRFVSDPRWSTLGDMSDGDFLECFFQKREIFRKYIFPK